MSELLGLGVSDAESRWIGIRRHQTGERPTDQLSLSEARRPAERVIRRRDDQPLRIDTGLFEKQHNVIRAVQRAVQQLLEQHGIGRPNHHRLCPESGGACIRQTLPRRTMRGSD